jgi:hypothetical protein
MRRSIEPSGMLALRVSSWITVDKITTVRRDRIGASMGHLWSEGAQRLLDAVAVFLGLGG